MTSENEDEEPKGTFGQFIGCLAMFGVGGAILAGAGWWIWTLLSGSSALVAMRLGPEFSETSFELPEPATVQGWADIEVYHPGISPSTAHSSLPHVTDFEIEITGPEGETHALRCNPFNSNYAKTSGEYNSVGRPAGRFYDGLMRQCSVQLPAGSYRVRARATKVSDDSKIRFERKNLILRTD